MSTSAASAQHEFPYEELLAYYRGRIEPSQRAEFQRLVTHDPRWKAHWLSIQQLDLEREAAQQDGVQLRTFLDDPVSELCEQVASQGEQLLSGLLQQNPPPEIAGRPIGQWREHVASCVYCRRMRRRAYSLQLKQQGGLADSEPLLRDWLLEDYYLEQLNRVTQSLLLRATQREAGEVADLLTFGSDLTGRLEQALAVPAARRQSAIDTALFEHDPLYAAAAGEEARRAIITRPSWFTCLTEPPASLSWQPLRTAGPWWVRLMDETGREIFSSQALHERIDLPLELRARMGVEADISWQVQEQPDPRSKAVVRGAWRILSATRTAALNQRLAAIQTSPPSLRRDLLIADALHGAGLYDAAWRHLQPLENRYARGVSAFLVQRAMAAVLWTMSNELTGERMLGVPEGLWAAELSSEHLAKAYAALGIVYRGDQ